MIIPLKVGVVGVGHLGKYHAEKFALNPKCELVGVSDKNEKVGSEIARKYNCSFHPDFTELLQKVNAISIATPTITHFNISKIFLENKTHVLVEKPITASYAEATELAKIAKNHTAKLFVGHVERFNPCVVALKNYLQEHQNTIQPKNIIARRITGYNPRANDVSVISDLMIHDIDLANFIFQQNVRAIKATGFKVFTNQIDIADVIIQFDNNLSASFSANRGSLYPLRRFEVFDSNLSLSLDLQNRSFTRSSVKLEGTNNQIKNEILDIEQEDALKNEIDAFISSILLGNDHSSLASAEDGIKALDIANKISQQIDAQTYEEENL